MKIDKIALTVAALLVVLPLAAQAQTKKKKKRAAAKQTSVYVPPTTDPQVVSRASDYSEEPKPADTTTVVSPVPQESPKPSNTSKRVAQKPDYEEKQRRIKENLDILKTAEERLYSLRKQRFELIEKENQITTRLSQIDVDIQPSAIEKEVSLSGSLRPEDLREARRKSLESERNNLNSLLSQVQATHSSLDLTLAKAEEQVQKLQRMVEADIDKSLEDDDNQQP